MPPTWADVHPVLATVLAFPPIVTTCLLLLGLSGFDFSIGRKP